MATLTEMQTWLTTRLPTGYFSSTLTTTQLTSLLNEVQREVCRRHNFQWMKRECTQSSVDNQYRYDLPDGESDDVNSVRVWRFKQDISLELINYDSTRRPLTRAIKNDIENDGAFSDTSDTGTPTHYAIDHFDIWLYPTPDHDNNSDTAWTLNLEYWGYLPDLASGTDTNFLTDHAPELLEFGAMAKALEFGEDYEKAQYWLNRYMQVLGELIEEDLTSEYGGIETGLLPLDANALGGGRQSPTVYSSGGYVDE